MIETVLLEEVAEDVTVGHVGPMAKEYVEDGIPFLRSLNVQPLRVAFDEVKYISPAFHRKLKKSALKPGDVVIVRTGKPGTCAVIPETLPVSNCSDLVIVRCGPRIRPRFLAYWVNAIATDHVASHIVGAVQQHFNVGAARKLPIILPTIPEQDKILSLLGALDDKIEVNRRMAATLEEMARALYRSWFVDFDPVTARVQGRAPAHMGETTAALFPARLTDAGLPEGWEMGTLGDIARNRRDQVQPSAIDPETPYVGLEHMPRRSIAIGDWGVAGDVGSAKSRVAEGSFLFGKLRPYFHKVGLAPVDGICSTDILVVEPVEAVWSGLVLSVISSDAFVEHANATSSGTRMPRANWGDMARYEVVVPDRKVASAFCDLVAPMHARIVQSIHENRTLAALRDALLPKLMSGELRVREAEARVAEAV